MYEKNQKKDQDRCTSMMTVLRRRWLGGTGRRDQGVSLVEVLVAVVGFAVLAMSATGLLRLSVHNGAQGVNRTEVHGTQLDASSLLARDVREGTVLHAAEDHTLVVDVVRDGTCWNRTYELGTELTVTTIYYEQAACRGPSVTKVETLVQNIVAADSKFTYYTDIDTALAPPIDDLRSVKRIGWALSSDADGWENPLRYSGASVFTGLGDTTGTGEETLQASRAVLTVTTGTAEGKNAPVLTWVNPNPADYVSQWVLFRAANPEGAATTDADRGNWSQVGPTFPAATLTWTDTTLPAGYTASYVVRPVLTDGTRGPESNAVVTGLRPAQVTGLTATGQATSVALKWNAAIGATSYDLYRDGVLFAHTTATTYTDRSGESGWTGSGYGHSHSLRVVGVNRWEQLATTGAQDGVVALGAAADLVFPRMSATRILSATVGAFTAPAAPSISATPTTSWSTVVARTYAGWTGAGPTALGGASRDRGWEVQRASLTGGWSVLWAESASAQQTHTGRTPGSTDRYMGRACNSSGCGPWSLIVSALQRPPAPAACTASGATTRSMTVTVAPAAMEAGATAFDVTGGTGDPTGGAAQSGATFTIDRLRHATAQAFTARTQNASPANSGWSDGTSCVGATQTLTISAPTVTSRSTRAITASFTAGNGTDRSITLENVGTVPGTSGGWDPLADGTGYVLTSRNGDGYNEISAQASTSTVGLTAPSCSVSGGGTGPSGTITVSASGSNGSRQVNAGAGWVTGSSTTRSGLAGGTYAGTARATDGHNYTGTIGCGSVTVVTPFSPTAWGDRGACPAVGVYVTPTSTYTYNVRQSGPDACQARMVVTQAGYDSGVGNLGEVIAYYGSTVTGREDWHRTSGSSSAPSTLPAAG